MWPHACARLHVLVAGQGGGDRVRDITAHNDIALRGESVGRPGPNNAVVAQHTQMMQCRRCSAPAAAAGVVVSWTHQGLQLPAGLVIWSLTSGRS
jgi:hypothetical protein